MNYKSMCAMGGSSMFHKPKTSSLMMMMDGNSVDGFHSHPRPKTPHPIEVMHPDPPHMEMHDIHSAIMSSPALHHQSGHMMLPPPPPPRGYGPLKTMQSPFVGFVNALNPWNLLDRFKLN